MIETSVMKELVTPLRLFNFEALRKYAYWRAALRRGRHLFQSKKSYSNEISKPLHCLFPNNNKYLPIWYIILYIPDLIIVSIFPLFVYSLPGILPSHISVITYPFWFGYGWIMMSCNAYWRKPVNWNFKCKFLYENFKNKKSFA